MGWLGRDRLPKMSSEQAAVQHSSGLGTEISTLVFSEGSETFKAEQHCGKNPLESLGIPPSFERIYRKKPSKVQRSLLLVMSQRALAPLLS